jgi:hypothetical protein
MLPYYLGSVSSSHCISGYGYVVIKYNNEIETNDIA